MTPDDIRIVHGTEIRTSSSRSQRGGLALAAWGMGIFASSSEAPGDATARGRRHPGSTQQLDPNTQKFGGNTKSKP